MNEMKLISISKRLTTADYCLINMTVGHELSLKEKLNLLKARGTAEIRIPPNVVIINCLKAVSTKSDGDFET